MDYKEGKQELYNILEFSEAKKNVILNNLIYNDEIYYESINVSQDVYKDTEIDKWCERLPSLDGSKKLINNLIKNPIKDLDLLQKRQQIYLEYDIDFTKLKEHENDVLWIYSLNQEIKQNNLIYVLFPSTFIISYINYISPLLDLYHIYKIFINPISAIVYPLMSIFAPLYYLRKYLKFNISISTYISMLFNIFKMVFTFTGNIKINIMRLITIMFYIFIFAYNIYQTIEYSYMLYDVKRSLYNKLCGLTTFIEEAQKIIKSLPYDIIDPFIKVNSNVIINDISLSNTMSNIYKLWKSNDMKEKITKLLLNIYTIDIINSVSKLKNKNWCLVEYSNSTKLWHMKNPLLSLKQKANPVDLSKNIVITGPNAAGKTTYVKTILSNVVLSQSLGIAYALKANVMIYDTISSFMRITDTLGSKSYFEAEAEYCLNMMKQAKELQDKNEKGLFLMDEPMHSTPPTEGMSTAFAVAEYMGKLSGINIILTTHFHKLTSLENEYPDKFLNLSVEAIPKDNGFIFPYNIRKGHSYQCIAIELLLTKQFPKSVIDTAVNMKNKICTEISR